MKKKDTYPVGGQAVIEGVMLRNESHYTIAVRKEDTGEIVAVKEKIQTISDKHTFLKAPFLRGIVNFAEMLILGYKALTFSANQQLQEGEQEEPMTKGSMAIALGISLLFALALFIVLPYISTTFIAPLLKIDEGANPAVFNLIRSGLKLLVFFIYVFSISFMKDIKRVFQYHGAEHKTVNAYEKGVDINMVTVNKQSTLHPRCGTTFLFLVIFVSLFFYIGVSVFVNSLVFNVVTIENAKEVVFILFGAKAPVFKQLPGLVTLLTNIILLPIVAGVSYELLKLAYRFEKNPLLKVMILPGLLFQKITTAEPDMRQLEVAISAFRVLMSDADVVAAPVAEKKDAASAWLERDESKEKDAAASISIEEVDNEAAVPASKEEPADNDFIMTDFDNIEEKKEQEEKPAPATKKTSRKTTKKKTATKKTTKKTTKKKAAKKPAKKTTKKATKKTTKKKTAKKTTKKATKKATKKTTKKDS